jgi:hypothetical protein
MTDHFEDYEAEGFENAGRGARLLPEEREALQEALDRSLEILNAPGEADADLVLRVVEAFDELHPYFPDTLVSDGIGEVIELLHEILEDRILDFEDAQQGKRTVEAVAQALELGFTCPDHGVDSLEGGGAADEAL